MIKFLLQIKARYKNEDTGERFVTSNLYAKDNDGRSTYLGGLTCTLAEHEMLVALLKEGATRFQDNEVQVVFDEKDYWRNT